MKTKAIVISDVHYADKTGCPERRGEIGDVLLLRAVRWINRHIKPDVVCLLGDFVDDADIAHLREVRGIVNLLEAPHIVLPGNHDGSLENFFKIFPEPPDHLDVGDCRFIPFTDPEEPGYNASRTQTEIERMRSLASEWSGPVVSLQHVPLFTPGARSCYNYVNADDITNAMSECGVTHAISGHYHRGFNLRDPRGLEVIVAPALCEKPFRFLEVEMDSDGTTTVSERSLAMDEALGLSDCHIHTSFAYCNENMDFARTAELRDDFNLKTICYSEHTAHLYLDRSEYAEFAKTGATTSSEPRMARFLDEAGAFRSERALLGFEVDCDFSGKPFLRDSDRREADLLIGAIHFLPPDARNDLESAKTAFTRMMKAFVQFPMDVLAHPFRVFRRSGLEIPEELFPFAVGLLKENGIAAEINFHTNEPPPKFFEMCLNEGVEISLGSDSHNLYEVGEFHPHLELLASLGCADSDLEAILFRPGRRG